MTSIWFFIALEISTIACAVVSGVFLAFSDFLMRSFDRANGSAGIDVMQVLNREVFRWVFMTLLLGMAAASPLFIAYAYLSMSGPASAVIIAGGTAYLVGVFAVSFLFNVPMNNRLARLEHSSAQAATYWSETYFPKWTFWNYVRAISAAMSASCYLIACVWLAQGSPALG